MKFPGLDIRKVLFLDVETVPQSQHFDDLDERMQGLWEIKARTLGDGTAEELYEKAGIYAEFGKIVCITTGFIRGFGGDQTFRIKSFYGDDEKVLLQEFRDLLDQHFNTLEHYLCAHNGKEFDFPYIARRMIINGVELPVALDIAGKKPWEVRHLDTMQLWKFGDFKSYTSLDLLAAVLGIPTPKDDIKGSDVSRVYYEENDLERIVAYCQKDVVALAQVMLRFMGAEMISDNQVVVV